MTSQRGIWESRSMSAKMKQFNPEDSVVSKYWFMYVFDENHYAAHSLVWRLDSILWVPILLAELSIFSILCRHFAFWGRLLGEDAKNFFEFVYVFVIYLLCIQRTWGLQLEWTPVGMQSGLCFSIFAENRKDYQVGFPGLQQRSISARGIKVGKVVSSSNSSVVEEYGVLVVLLF